MTEGSKLTFVVVVVSEDQLKQVMLEPPRVARQGSAHRNRANRTEVIDRVAPESMRGHAALTARATIAST